MCIRDRFLAAPTRNLSWQHLPLSNLYFGTIPVIFHCPFLSHSPHAFLTLTPYLLSTHYKSYTSPRLFFSYMSLISFPSLRHLLVPSSYTSCVFLLTIHGSMTYSTVGLNTVSNVLNFSLWTAEVFRLLKSNFSQTCVYLQLCTCSLVFFIFNTFRFCLLNSIPPSVPHPPVFSLCIRSYYFI